MDHKELMTSICVKFECDPRSIKLSGQIPINFTNIIEIHQSFTTKLLYGFHPMRGWCEIPEINTVHNFDKEEGLQIHNGVWLIDATDAKSYLFFLNVIKENGYKSYELFKAPTFNDSEDILQLWEEWFNN